MIAPTNDKISQDEAGVWWYRQSASKRQKCSVSRCEWCEEEFVAYGASARRFCSRMCAAQVCHRNNHFPVSGTGEKSRRWQGGRRIVKGYVLIWKPDHPSLKGTKRKYVGEHRLVMEEILGRILEPTERVHHINLIKSDNHPENLELWESGHPPGMRGSDRTIDVPVSLFLEMLRAFR